MTESEQRATIVKEAMSWLGTPYRHAGRVKGRAGGTDCIMIIAEAFTAIGLIKRPVIPAYPQDWHLHRGAERYMAGLMQNCREIAGPPQPGDIALWRFGRAFSHGAIVVEWPTVVHAWITEGVVLCDTSCVPMLQTIGESERERGKPRPVKFFSYWSQ